MSLINQIEYWHNKASDSQFVWFPFQFLKPKPNEIIQLPLKAKMSICFGFYYGVFAALRGWIFSNQNPVHSLGSDILIAIAIFAVWFSVVTAPLWNRRAQRLLKERAL
jgi:hypothetical protein